MISFREVGVNSSPLFLFTLKEKRMERIEADLYFERVDLTHWKVYVNEINDNSYWLICAKNMKEAIKRFKSFSVYKSNIHRTYWVLPKEAR